MSGRRPTRPERQAPGTAVVRRRARVGLRPGRGRRPGNCRGDGAQPSPLPRWRPTHGHRIRARHARHRPPPRGRAGSAGRVAARGRASARVRGRHVRHGAVHAVVVHDPG